MYQIFTIPLPCNPDRRQQLLSGITAILDEHPVSMLIQDALVITVADLAAAGAIRQFNDAITAEQIFAGEAR